MNASKSLIYINYFWLILSIQKSAITAMERQIPLLHTKRKT